MPAPREIPGFYWDDATNRYYRYLSGASPGFLPTPSVSQTIAPKIEQFPPIANSQSLLKDLVNRDIHSSTFSTRSFQARYDGSRKRRLYNVPLFGVESPRKVVVMDERFPVTAALTMGEEGLNMIAEDSTWSDRGYPDMPYEGCMGHHEASVRDFCLDASGRHLLVVEQSMGDRATCRFGVLDEEGLHDYQINSQRFRAGYRGAIHAIASSRTPLRAYIGGEKYCAEYDIETGKTVWTSRDQRSDVFAMQESTDSTALFRGHRGSFLSILDTRSPKFSQCDQKVFKDLGITNLAQRGYQLLCSSSHENHGAIIDLRQIRKGPILNLKSVHRMPKPSIHAIVRTSCWLPYGNILVAKTIFNANGEVFRLLDGDPNSSVRCVDSADGRVCIVTEEPAQGPPTLWWPT